MFIIRIMILRINLTINEKLFHHKLYLHIEKII